MDCFLKSLFFAAILSVTAVAGCRRGLPAESVELREPMAMWKMDEIVPWTLVDQKDHSGTGRWKVRTVTFERRGNLRTLQVHFPHEGWHDQKRPCVLLAPSGSNLVTGRDPIGSQDYVQEYLKRGMVAVTYGLDGDLHPQDARDRALFAEAYRLFVASKAGLANSAEAFHYVVEHVDLVDPNQIFIAGYSSGATHALLFAAHEQRLAGCIAYSPDPDLSDFDSGMLKDLGRFLPGIGAFVTKANPTTHIEQIQCPVFLFATMDDEKIPFDHVARFAKSLRKVNSKLVFKWQEAGGHSAGFQLSTMKLGATWITQILED